MRVLLVTTSYPLDPMSSSGIFVARLARSLMRVHAVRVIVPADWRKRSLQDTLFRGEEPVVLPYRYALRSWQRLAHVPGGIPVALKKTPWLYLLVPPFLASMFLSCLRHGRKMDVIHANWAICGLVAGFAGRLLGVPVVVSLRGEDMTRGAKKGIDRWILKACLSRCERVIGVSNAIVEKLQEMFPEQAGKLRLVENGVNGALLQLERKETNEEELRLLAVGSLIPRKGVEVTLAALAAVPGISLSIVGEGPEQAALQQLAEDLGIAHRVRFLGALQPEAVHEQLARHDVLVLSSYSEGRPNVVLEAMAAAMPVLASDISGVDELVQHASTGLLFPAGDESSLAAHIERLAGDRELAQTMGRNGRQRILDMGLTWEQSADACTRIYQEIGGAD